MSGWGAGLSKNAIAWLEEHAPDWVRAELERSEKAEAKSRARLRRENIRLAGMAKPEEDPFG